MDFLSEYVHLQSQIYSNVESLVFEDSGFLHEKHDSAADHTSLALTKAESSKHLQDGECMDLTDGELPVEHDFRRCR